MYWKKTLKRGGTNFKFATESIPFNKLYNVRSCISIIRSKRSLNFDKVRIAIIGSRNYQSSNKIKDMIFKLKQQFGSNLEIVSGGAQHGADKWAKKYAIELGVDYVEFNPAHTSFNLYSGMPESYYGQPYHVSQLFHRNTLIAMYCDKMIAFRTNGKSTGTDHAVGEAKKYEKPFITIGDTV